MLRVKVVLICLLLFCIVCLIFFSQENTQNHTQKNTAAMDLINSIIGSDEEGRSRQRILTFAAQR